ncbi:MAG: DUF2752 domain-containing protein [Bacteroidales bacterium]
MKILKWILLLIAVLVFYFIFSRFNPYQDKFFPKCIFLSITGYKCPGCGSQRAIHYLFNFDIASAFKENQLLVISIPYLILGFYFDTIKVKTEKQLKIRRFLFGRNAIFIVFTIIICFWILRNLL